MLWSQEGTYLIALLQKHLIIFTESDTKDDRRNVFKTVDPFLALTALAANVEHAAGRISEARSELGLNRGCPHTVYSIDPL
jgi:hypothetical protein